MSEIVYEMLKKEHCEGVEELLHICFPTMDEDDQYDADELEELAEELSLIHI